MQPGREKVKCYKHWLSWEDEYGGFYIALFIVQDQERGT